MTRRQLLPTATALLLTALAAGPAWAWSDDATLCAEGAAGRGAADAALAACTRALASADLTRAERARTLNHRGIIRELGGAYDRAFADYLDAVALHRRDPADDYPASAGHFQTVGFEPDRAVKSGWNSLKSGLGRVGRWFQQHGSTSPTLVTQPAAADRSYPRAPSSARAPSLRPASSPLVADIQHRLNALGFDAGRVDGRAGPRTRAAIVAFQESIGVAGDGEATWDLLARLDRVRAYDPAPPPSPSSEPGPDGPPRRCHALNDIVIQRYETGRMIELATWIGGAFVNSHGGDGLVIATPTGSTAYALSCGGPIMHPHLDAVVIAPISPHTLSDRPIVVRRDSEIEVRLNGRTTSRAQITFDGTTLGDLERDGRLVVGPARETVTLLHPHGHDYYRILRSKLHWGRSARETEPPA